MKSEVYESDGVVTGEMFLSLSVNCGESVETGVEQDPSVYLEYIA